MDDAVTCRELPARREVALGGFRIGLIHGWGDPAGVAARVAREFARVDCVVYGHTHVPENETRGGVLFFNPGSPTDRRWAPHRSLGILEVSDQIVGRLIALED